MSRESVRDLRQGGAVGPPRVRGPVRDRMSPEPEPDPAGQRATDSRVGLQCTARGNSWRIAATVLLALILVAVGVLLVIDSEPVDCGRLTAQSEWTPDVAAEMEENGCAP